MSSSCTNQIRHSKIKVEENKRKAVFRNKDQKLFEVTKIDDCLITEGKRCDYAVSEKNVASVLVELKGANVEHACKQLMETVQHAAVKSILEQRLGFLVVCSKYPRFDTFVAKAKTQAAREYKAGFHVVCDQIETDISEVTAIDGRPGK